MTEPTYTPSLCCPACNCLGTDHQQWRGRLGWWIVRCHRCGTVWSVWWALERWTGIRVSRTVWRNPGNVSAAEMLALIALRQQVSAREVER